jgi:hypothetical protein
MSGKRLTLKQISAMKCLDEAVNSRNNRGDETPWTSGYTFEVFTFGERIDHNRPNKDKLSRFCKRLHTRYLKKQRKERIQLRNQYEDRVNGRTEAA